MLPSLERASCKGGCSREWGEGGVFLGHFEFWADLQIIYILKSIKLKLWSDFFLKKENPLLMALKGSPRTLFLPGMPAIGFHGGRTVHIVSSVSFVGRVFWLSAFISGMWDTFSHFQKGEWGYTSRSFQHSKRHSVRTMSILYVGLLKIK